MARSKSSVSRKARLEKQIQQILALELMQNIKDNALQNVTIIEVAMTGDLHHAKVYFSASDDTAEDYALSSLNKSKGHFRKCLADELHTRITPTLEFVTDKLSQQITDIESILAHAKASDDELAKRRKSLGINENNTDFESNYKKLDSVQGDNNGNKDKNFE